MSTKTTHIIPSDDGWAVRKEGEHRASSIRGKKGDVFVVKHGEEWAVRKPHAERASAVLPTQAEAIGRAKELAGSGEIHVQHRDDVYVTKKEAIDAARDMVHRSSAGQIVVHGRDGSMSWRDVHGLPVVQKPPRKSDLGTKAIKKAVSTVIRERLEE
jgi:hypothetical protein